MPGPSFKHLYICSRYLRASNSFNVSLSASPPISLRQFSTCSPLCVDKANTVESVPPNDNLGVSATSEDKHAEPERGAMSRRLAEATEEALYEGGRAGRKAVEDAGFSEELKQKLLEKIEGHKFRSENAAAFAEAELASNVGRGSRDIATAEAWTGTENTEDTVLRMLDDTRKPLKPGLRGPAKIPSPVVDLRLKREPAKKAGHRLANARDKSSIYAISKDTQMTEREREAMRNTLKERFAPGAGPMPTSFRGLAALANERIEDAISRGQFKNIPRGKGVVRDTRSDNPFIDTTEYIMNKMIQRQDIVPPWIEKQQEIVKTANVFRGRLRADWKRHAARMIASRGGTLQQQMEAAERHAEAERLFNPKRRAVEKIAVPASATSDPVWINISQETAGKGPEAEGEIRVSLERADGEQPSSHTAQEASQADQDPAPTPTLFRVPAWEAAEMSYLKLAIQNLNNITRSYNLMAPDLAKKPYFSLERELKSCYADVAPQLATAIKDRAARPSAKQVEKSGNTPANLLQRFEMGETARVYESKKPLYGFREFWTDLFGQNKS